MLVRTLITIALLSPRAFCGENISKEIRPYAMFPVPFELPNRNDRSDQCWLRVEDVELTETVSIYCFIAQSFLRNHIHDYNSRKMTEDDVDVSLWSEEPRLPDDSLMPKSADPVDGQRKITDWKVVTVWDPITRMRFAYKEVLSQPPKDISHKQKLLWLQQRRKEGLWVQCDDCDRWRYLPKVLDSHELPAKWYCWMNPDTSLASCTAPEVPICLYDEDDLIHAEYAAGSVVLARMPGFPWWPAMVCDCPDTEQYYWIDGFSDIPTHYNVVFFDAFDVSRSWMTPEQLKPYKNNSKLLTKSLKIKNFKNRLTVAVTQANDAEKLPLSTRLAKYSFIARFNGKILTPKKIKKHEITRYRNMLKRKFNIVQDFDDESKSSEEDMEIEKKVNKKNNGRKEIKKTKKANTQSQKMISRETENFTENLNSTKDFNSLVVQIDNNSTLIESIDFEASNTKVQESNTATDSFVTDLQSQDATNTVQDYEADSEKSDNFDF